MEDKGLEKFIRRYEAATKQLIAAERELARLRDDQHVTLEWVCWYLNVDQPRAVRMLAEEAVYVFDETLIRFLKADIIQFAKRHRMQVKELNRDFMLRKPPKDKEVLPGQVSTPIPTTFAKFDDTQAIGDRYMKNFLARRDKAIERERAKAANSLPAQKQPKSKKKGG